MVKSYLGRAWDTPADISTKDVGAADTALTARMGEAELAPWHSNEEGEGGTLKCHHIPYNPSIEEPSSSWFNKNPIIKKGGITYRGKHEINNTVQIYILKKENPPRPLYSFPKATLTSFALCQCSYQLLSQSFKPLRWGGGSVR